MAQANQLYQSQLAQGEDVALYGLLGFLAGKFAPGGDWDFKKNYAPGTADQSAARTFGNFNFGAVLESLGFTYYFTQNAAGVAQVGICVFGGACGAGMPGIVFPYGDQVEDAVDIQRGYNYEMKVETGCRQQ